MNTATFVVDAPKAPTEVALPQLAPEGKLPVLAPVAKPQALGNELFTLAQRLDLTTHHAVSGHGTYVGRTLPERIVRSGYVTGTAAVLLGGAATCMATEWHPLLFIMGGIATGLTLIPVKFGLDLWTKRERATPVSVKHAEPYLEAFKQGDLATQTMVTWQAQKWAGKLAVYNVDGQELRQQLTEIAAVSVPADDDTRERIETIGALIDLMPRTGKDTVDCAGITSRFANLDGDDQTRVGALMLLCLFTGEQLRMGRADKRAVQALYSTLLATQPRNVTSREALQQYVSSS